MVTFFFSFLFTTVASCDVNKKNLTSLLPYRVSKICFFFNFYRRTIRFKKIFTAILTKHGNIPFKNDTVWAKLNSKCVPKKYLSKWKKTLEKLKV